MSSDGTGDDTKPPSGVMVNADGDFVVAEPDKASWEKYQAKTKSSAAAQKASALGDKELQDKGLECSIDKRMFIDPMKTPCCAKTYCNECITNALIESDFTCPGCQTDGVLIDNLVPDDDTSVKIKAYLEEKEQAKKEKELSQSPPVKSTTPDGTSDNKTKASSPKPTSTQTKTEITGASKAKSPTPKPQPSTANRPASSNGSKKRPADELMENPKVPKAPKAMQQQQAAKQAQAQMQQQQAFMASMAGFPMMPNMPSMPSMPNMPTMPNMPNMGFDMSQAFNPNAFSMGMNPMAMYGMPMMGGFPMGNGAFPGMNNGMGGFNQAGIYGNGNHAGGNSNGAGAGGYGGGIPSGPAGRGMGMNGAAGGFANQQKNFFADAAPSEEDNAYFRQPVNPHRHQGRQRRARPSDYREL